MAPATLTAVRFAPPSIGPDEIAEVVATLESGWLSTGPRVRAFEQAFADYIGKVEHRKTTILPLKCQEHIGSPEEHSFRTSIDQSPPRAKEHTPLAIRDATDHRHGPVVRLHLFKFVIFGRKHRR